MAETPRVKNYPLLAVSAHQKFRFHGQWNNVSWLADIYKYQGYEPVWMNAADSGPRGIKEKDIIRIFNDRDQILCYVHITERLMPGVIWVAEGSWSKRAEPGNLKSIDTGGNINVLIGGAASPHCYGEKYTPALVQVEKWVK